MGRNATALAGAYSIPNLPGSEGIPLYVRLAMSLRTRILQGEYKPGDRLPAFEQLAQDYGVAVNTVRKAIQMLTTESLLTSGRGSGTVVRPGNGGKGLSANLRATIRDPLALSPDVRIHVLSSETVKALPPELSEQYPTTPRYQRVLKTHDLEDKPFALLDIYIDHQTYSRFPPKAERALKLSQLLRDHGQAPIASSREELTISHADQRISSLLHYPIAAPLVRLRRWRMRGDGAVVYACLALYRSDMFVWDTTVAERSADHFNAHIIPVVKGNGRRPKAR